MLTRMDILSDTKLFFNEDPGGVYKPKAGAQFREGHAVLIVGARAHVPRLMINAWCSACCAHASLWRNLILGRV